MKNSVYAVDLAKHKFQVHGFDAHGERRAAKTLPRSGMLKYFDGHEAAGVEVVMEACASAHYWGRRLREGTGLLGAIDPGTACAGLCARQQDRRQ